MVWKLTREHWAHFSNINTFYYYHHGAITMWAIFSFFGKIYICLDNRRTRKGRKMMHYVCIDGNDRDSEHGMCCTATLTLKWWWWWWWLQWPCLKWDGRAGSYLRHTSRLKGCVLSMTFYVSPCHANPETDSGLKLGSISKKCALVLVLALVLLI